MKRLLIIILFLVSMCYAQLPDITKKYRAGDVGDSLLVSIIKFDTTATMFQRGDSLYIYSPALGDTFAIESLFNGTGISASYFGSEVLGSPQFQPADSVLFKNNTYFSFYQYDPGGSGNGDEAFEVIPDTTGPTGIATLALIITITDTLWSVWPDTVQKVVSLAWKNQDGGTGTYSSGNYNLLKWNYRDGVYVESLSPNAPDSFTVTVAIDTNFIATQDTLRQNYLPNTAFVDSLSNYGIYDSIGVAKGAIAKTLTASGHTDKLIFQLGSGLIHYNILASDTLGIEIDSSKYLTVKALDDSLSTYADSALQMINFFVGYTDNGMLDTDLTDEWYFNTSIGDEIDEFIQTPDRSDGTEYSDDVVFRVQIPNDYVPQDTLRIVLRGFTYVVLPTITRNSILTRVHKENEDGRAVSNIAYTDSVVFATGSTYNDNDNYEVKVNGSGIVGGDVLKIHLRSKLDATGISVYQVLYNVWIYYRRQIH